ncbi:SDR family NAD(P)-dependent oxidoreductase [Halomonas sp. TRM85114]|uniref:SDR family NAD(P)-dependent oxidoreductase n=1 Tax=Halomonas jincaotanensis TaxID=2810616 RepID=UPI001BD25404|nr:SDR family NAD(P)-dependent oxidoreductase [Halomonas jincaotanensis]MBS9404492.1 SDR family NAD(P)-dependent oxidoreductase [Halomonas jincaotanensis]
MLNQLPDGFSALVIGASGGIGRAVTDAVLASERPGSVVGVSRQKTSHPDPRFESLVLDVGQTDGLAALESHLEGRPLHFVFNAIGILHDVDSGIAPEKKLADLDAEAMTRLFHINAITPALLLKALEGNFKGRHTALFASLSARVGSIGDNHLGGWYAYRASKAAHNMLMKTAAVELRRLNPEMTVVCLHPGTTDTALSLPFQERVPEGKLFTPSFVAERLLAVLDKLPKQESGLFLDWAGKPVPW